MIKLFGAVLIISAFSVWGFLKAISLKKRLEEVEKIITAFTLLENEITYGKRDIKTVLKTVGEMSGAKIFTVLSENMEKGVFEAFNKAMALSGENLLDKDKEILKTAFSDLGLTDTESQIKTIRHAKEALCGVRNSAFSDYENKGKLYRNMGVLTGLGIAIILL